MRDTQTFWRTNVEGTQHVIDAALVRKVRRFIYTSTIDVFRAAPGQSYDESEIDSHPKGTVYEQSKQEADKRVASALQQGLPAIFLHPSGVYGPGPTESPGLNALISRFSNDDVPLLLPGGLPVVYAPDVGEGHVLAEEKAAIGRRYILSESYHELSQLARLILDALGKRQPAPAVLPLPIAKAVAAIGEWIAQRTDKPPLIPRGQLQFLQWRAHPQSVRAQNELGWSTTPLRQGLRQTVEFLRKQQMGDAL
jgi:dihydroflavonol-4-reductase